MFAVIFGKSESLSLIMVDLDISWVENSVDPDQLASADQDLYCFLLCLQRNSCKFPEFYKLIGYKLERSVVHETCVKRPLKNRLKNIFMTNGSLMKVNNIAECILEYFDLH